MRCSQYRRCQIPFSRLPILLGEREAVLGKRREKPLLMRFQRIEKSASCVGSFQIACTPDATREQTETCYPQLKTFLTAKRRFDPHERLVNAWYLHQRGLFDRSACEVRWAN